MIPYQFEKFMRFVLEQTRSGRLKWYAGEGLSFVASNKDVSLYISSDFDPDREIATFWFRLNGNGVSTPFSVTDSESDYNQMKILFEEVIANANDADIVMKNFMEGFD